MQPTTLRNTLAILCLGAALTACGGGGSDSSASPIEPTTPPIEVPPPVDNEPEQPLPGDDEPGEQPGPGGNDGGNEPGEDPTPVNGSALLTWDAPNTRTDASCLTDLVAYRISYGTSPGFYPESRTVAVDELQCQDTGVRDQCGPVKTCSYKIEDLGEASWHFVIQAVDGNGSTSDYSNQAIKTIERLL